MNFSFITDIFFPNKTPERINNGDCFNWALICHLILKKKKINSELYNAGDYFHAFIKVDDKFYDSEAPTGVPVITKLPIFVKYPGCAFRPEKKSYPNFVTGWKEYGVNGDMIKHIPALVEDFLSKKEAA